MNSKIISTRLETDSRLLRQGTNGWIEVEAPPLGAAYPDGEPAHDPENPPMNAEQLARVKRIPFVRHLRLTLSLTLEEFSRRYQIPLETLKSWERGQSEPDAPAMALLKLVAANPEVAAAALRAELSAVPV